MKYQIYKLRWLCFFAGVLASFGAGARFGQEEDALPLIVLAVANLGGYILIRYEQGKEEKKNREV